VLQLLNTVLSGCHQSYDSVVWPRIKVAQHNNWTTAEDSLLWLGIIRYGLRRWADLTRVKPIITHCPVTKTALLALEAA